MGFHSGEKVILLKPLTYMNLSGESIRAVMDYYRNRYRRFGRDL